MPRILSTIQTAWTLSAKDNTGLLAAGIAFYAFLSFMPLLAAAALSYGLFADADTLARHTSEISATLPPSTSELISNQLESVTKARSDASGIGLVFAIALSLFGARLAAGALIKAVNVAFGVEEERGLLRSNLMAIALTVGAVISLAIVGIAARLASTALNNSGGAFSSYVLVGLAGFGGAFLAYRVVPNMQGTSKSAAAQGAALFAVGWMLASAAFGIYAANFGNYNATYGSLGAVVIFLTWMYLSAYLLLFGAYVAAARMAETSP